MICGNYKLGYFSFEYALKKISEETMSTMRLIEETILKIPEIILKDLPILYFYTKDQLKHCYLIPIKDERNDVGTRSRTIGIEFDEFKIINNFGQSLWRLLRMGEIEFPGKNTEKFERDLQKFTGCSLIEIFE